MLILTNQIFVQKFRFSNLLKKTTSFNGF